jgi:hypothetical protein
MPGSIRTRHMENMAPGIRGSHSFRFQLKLSISVHRVTQLNSGMCPGVAQVELLT